ncbi:site-specific integrase [Pontibacter diazotrophicus]|uniref:Site-specific integrase n=1 Tax=Pontibacter diazotrophicus TaxID=1400979 RepID=A0A3D8LGJ5_9BACT|nr:site-specific integrase [Pontibacter diazotrophicus]RDV16543.1 site-specific integrase [Pontibacter diazotrophicus]
MTLNYYLDKPNLDGETSIYLFARLGKQTIKVKIGMQIHPSYWNAKPNRQGNHIIGSYKGAGELNFSLGDLKNRVRKAYNKRLEENPSFRFADFKEDIIAQVHPTEPEKEKSFVECYDEYIHIHGAHRSRTTLLKYRGIYNHLVAFGQKKKYVLSFQGMDMRFFDDLRNYLVQDLKHKDNTVWKTFATLKAFLGWALERGYHQNLSYKKFKAPQKDVDIIYLTKAELDKLNSFDLSKHPRLDRVRDVFCFACATGQRYSDVAALRHSDIKGNRWVLRQVKTDTANSVPLSPRAMAILEKYKEELYPLPVLSNQKTNDYLKELGELVGLDEPTSMTTRRGGERLVDTKPKYDFLTMHTARRTFITLSLEGGMRAEVVMKVSGHTNYQTFKKYIKITDNIKELEMERVWGKVEQEEAVLLAQ